MISIDVVFESKIVKLTFLLINLYFFGKTFTNELKKISTFVIFFFPKIAFGNYINANHFLDLNMPLQSWKLKGA